MTSNPSLATLIPPAVLDAGLDESMQLRTVFHGTFEPEIPESDWHMRRLFHFGTRQSAIERLAKLIHYEGAKGTPRIVEFEHPFAQDEILQLAQDWRTNGPIELALALSSHYKVEAPATSQRFELIRARYVEAKADASDYGEEAELKSIAAEQLASAIDDLGIRCISYPNDVEDKGVMSYCSVTPFVMQRFLVSTPSSDELNLAS